MDYWLMESLYKYVNVGRFREEARKRELKL